MANGYHHIRTVEQLHKFPFPPVAGVKISPLPAKGYAFRSPLGF